MELQKPWDVDALKKSLVDAGLPVAEETIFQVASALFNWADASATLEGGAIAMIGKPAVSAARAFIMPHIDSIDKKDDGRV